MDAHDKKIATDLSYEIIKEVSQAISIIQEMEINLFLSVTRIC